jgi:predicted lipoprotein with Yx(FWY)xxD motif
LLLATGAIHLDLYLNGYRTIPTIGWLFLVQVIVAFFLAIAVVVLQNRLAAAVAALFALCTLGGYLLSLWIGLFGFREVGTTAGLAAGILEVAAFAALGSVALSGGWGRTWARLRPDKSRDIERVEIGTVVALSIIAAALLGSALVTAPGGSTGVVRSAPELKALEVGGANVLTNARGLTLYLFVPDSATISRCYGECAAYWPPVLGKPKAGPGVTGRLGSIRRSDGSIQATYDGHPLYTYVADTAPGQANGNAIDLNGGYWYEVTTSGGRG